MKKLIAILGLVGPLAACTGSGGGYSPLISAEPEIGSVLRYSPSFLRLYFDAMPDVDSSDLTLTGPDGSYELRGLHTMGANDLMVEVASAALTDGDYVVQWSAETSSGTAVYEGKYEFSIVTGR